MSDFANLLSVITYVHNYRFCPSGPISNSAQSPFKMSDYPPLHSTIMSEFWGGWQQEIFPQIEHCVKWQRQTGVLKMAMSN